MQDLLRLLGPMIGGVVAGVVAIGGASHALAHQGRGKLVHESTSAAPAPDYVPPKPETLGGPFELVDHTGREVTDATFRGRWMLMFFGYTGCREACPVALDRLTEVLAGLGADNERIQPLFVDIDFAGPDLKGLAQFVSNFHPRLLGLTGNRRQMHALLRAFQVRREIKHGTYGKKETGPRIDHTTHFFLIDPEGKTRAYFYHGLSPADMVAHIRRHL